MFGLLSQLSKNLTLAIPLAMGFGFLAGWGLSVGWMKHLIVPLTFLMVYPMMVTLKISMLFAGGDGKAQGLAQLINFAIIPFLAYALGRFFFPEQPYYAVGLLLAALLPTSGMTISWTGFAGGNLGAAVKMTVLGLILGSLATPFYLQWLMGTRIPVDFMAVFWQIIFIVFLPMLAGYITQSLLIRKYGVKAFQSEWGPRFPPLSTLGVLGIVFVAIALKGATLVAHPEMLLDILLPLFVLYLFNYAFSTFIARRLLPRGDAIALVYGTVMRNLSIALALAMNAFGAAGEDAALLIAVAYVIQVQSAAWYVKFGDRFFGPKPV